VIEGCETLSSPDINQARERPWSLSLQLPAVVVVASQGLLYCRHLLFSVRVVAQPLRLDGLALAAAVAPAVAAPSWIIQE